jgi:transcriptional regulator with GAF, ATPase, and Fis domain
MTPFQDITTLNTPIKLEEAVGNFERHLIIQALNECDGVQTRTAELLGTTRRILRYRMDKLGIPIRRQPMNSSSCRPVPAKS